MGTARLIIDPTGRFSAPKSALIVAKSENYAAARALLYACIEPDNQDSAIVVIHNPALRTWFEDLRGSPHVQYEEYSPLRDLERRLGIAAPDGLLDLDVIELQLDELAETNPPNAEAMETWIVRHRAGEVWLRSEPSQVSLADVIALLAESELRNQWIIQRIQTQLNLWQRSDTQARAQIWRFLRTAPSERALALAAYAAVSRYPRETIKPWLGDLWLGLDTFDALGDAAAELETLPAPPRLAVRLDEEVRRFLTDKTEDAAMDQLLSYTSGKLRSEAGVLARVLMTNRLADLDASVFGKVKAIAQRNDNALIEKLAKYVPVATPKPVPGTAMAIDLKAITEWAAQEYLPWYRSVRYRADSVEADGVCESFAAWLRRSYPDVLLSLHGSVLSARDRIQSLLNADMSVLWIIIDGLGMEYADLLSNICLSNNMQVTEDTLLLTVIPSVTHLAKPSVLTGCLPAQRPNSGQTTSIAEYRRLIEADKWGPDGMLISADWESQRLSRVVATTKASVWTYLVNQLDTNVIHKTMPYEDRAVRARQICTELVAEVREAQETALARHGLRPAVVFTADHGSTTPSPGAIAVVYDGQSSHGRCIHLDDAEAAPSDGWITLEPPSRFGLADRYAVAYGNRFIGETSSSCSTHGGANPEEVFVPYIECDGIAPQMVVPRLRTLNTVKVIATPQPLLLDVTNLNSVAVRALEIELEGADAVIRVPVLARHATVQLEVTITLTALDPGEARIDALVRFVSSGDIRHEESSCVIVTVEAPLQTASEAQSEFEGMFDD